MNTYRAIRGGPFLLAAALSLVLNLDASDRARR